MSTVLGLDFGTTNTVGALPDGGAPLQFRMGDVASSVFRTSLCFWRDRTGREHTTRAEAGPWAIDMLLKLHDGGRFFQSIKTHAASPSFRGTNIFGRSATYEDLMLTFLERYFEKLEDFAPADVTSVVVGRPVAYSGATAQAAVAETRYRSAFAALGIADVHFVFEPVAAAYYFIQRLQSDAVVFVADLGGGTSDFTLFRFEKTAGAIDIRPLGVSGIGIAGDNFDQRIIANLVAPELGKGSLYRSFGKELEIPGSYFLDMSRWNALSLMRNEKTIYELEKLQRVAVEPDKLGRLIDFIEMERAYDLYKAISDLKTALSRQEIAPLQVDLGDVRLAKEVRRRDFEGWIEPDLDRIATAADEVLTGAGLAPEAVTKVFLTGGTSQIPAVRQLFADKFRHVAIETGDELVSIARGLALIGKSPDLETWCVRESGAVESAPARRIVG